MSSPPPPHKRAAKKAAPAKRAVVKKVPASQAKKRPKPPPPPEEPLVEVDEDGYLIEPDYEPEPEPEREPPRRPAVRPLPAAPAPAPTKKRLPTGFSTLRDLLLFIAGMAVIGNEVFISESVDPTAVGIGVALTGAPLVFGADEKKTGGGAS